MIYKSVWVGVRVDLPVVGSSVVGVHTLYSVSSRVCSHDEGEGRAGTIPASGTSPSRSH